jgi:Na+-transporting methylmalonyl-CoA/oxaloacetate decarboxylase gamma subunit
MIEYLNDGLVVTGLGMGLVFFTLFICLLVIKLLDRVFKPQPEVAEAEAAAAPVAPPPPPAATADEAAAVAVALVLQQRKNKPPVPAKPKETGEEIVGGVMIVKPIVPAPWSGPARKAVN